MKELPFAPYDFFGYIASGLVLVVLAQLTFGFPKVFGTELRPFDMAVTVLGVYIAGQIVAGPAKFFFEDLLVHKILGSPTTNLLTSKPPRFLKFFFPGFYKPLPEGTREKVREKVRTFNLLSPEAEGIFLIVRYAPEVRESESLIRKIDTFRDMYGFSRNVSFSLLLAAMGFAVVGHHRGSQSLMHFSVMAFIAGILLFYRYLKFFRQYSFELFSAYAYMAEKSSA